MNDYFIQENSKRKIHPMVDFNYNTQKNRNFRNSMFQLFTPNLNTKNISNNNPKDLFTASNKINSILSKNLNAIYQENKNENAGDTPLYENVNYLIQKNNNSNKYIYNQILSFRNELNTIKNNISRKSYFEYNSKKRFRNSAIIHTTNNDIFNPCIKNSIKPYKRSSYQSQFLPDPNQNDTIIGKNMIDQGHLGNKKRNSGFANKFKNKRRSSNYETETLNVNDMNKLNKILKDNYIISKRHNSSFIAPINQLN